METALHTFRCLKFFEEQVVHIRDLEYVPGDSMARTGACIENVPLRDEPTAFVVADDVTKKPTANIEVADLLSQDKQHAASPPSQDQCA
jgi:hypothetical protein